MLKGSKAISITDACKIRIWEQLKSNIPQRYGEAELLAKPVSLAKVKLIHVKLN